MALVVALLCGVMLLSLHGRDNHARATSTPTAAATSQPHTLAWRRAELPPGASSQSGAGFAVSPLDGQTAWACVPAVNGSFAIWVTRDAAVTWSALGTVAPAATPEPITVCTLVPDQLDPRTLAADFDWGSGEAGTLRTMSYVSNDGGAHWQRVPGDIGVGEIGSIGGGTTYAVLADTAAPSLPPLGLVISADGLQSWQALRPADLAVSDSIFRFWMQRSGGQIFAASLNKTLWMTDGTGSHWSRLNSRSMQTDLGAWSGASNQWLFCHWGDTQTLQLGCSADLGQTWTPRPAFDSVQQCGACGKGGAPYTSIQSCYPNALMESGALVAVCPTTGSNPSQPQFFAFSLAPDANAWTNLGSAPAPFYAAAATGQLWCLDAQTQTLYVATLPA